MTGPVAMSRWGPVVVVFVVAVAMTGARAGSDVPSGTHSLSAADAKLVANHSGGDAGWQVSAGDLDGDGVDDLVIGAWLDDTNGDSVGAVYVVYGPVDGPINLSSEAKLLGELPGDFAGEGTVANRDLDNDGFDDIVIGAPGRIPGLQPGTPAPGQVYIIYGGPDRLDESGNLSEAADATLVGEHPGDTLGHAVDGGDFDSDGVDDIVVSASGFGGMFPGGQGKIHVVYGEEDERLNGRIDVTEAADAAFLGEQQGASTGQWVDGTRDFDGDGSDDILVGAPGWGGVNGVAYLLYGGGLPNGTMPLTVAADARLVGERPLSTAGLGITGGGDIDDDGVDDFVVSAPATPDDSVPGTAYLFYGGPERITGTMPVGAAADTAIVGEGPGDDTGLGIEIAGDLDRDGVDDLVVGAGRNDSSGENAGAVSVVPGGPRLTGTHELSDIRRVKLTGEAAGDRAGIRRSLHGRADVNGDNRPDLLVGATGHQDAGAVYVIYGTAPGCQPSTVPPENPPAHAGSSSRADRAGPPSTVLEGNPGADRPDSVAQTATPTAPLPSRSPVPIQWDE